MRSGSFSFSFSFLFSFSFSFFLILLGGCSSNSPPVRALESSRPTRLDVLVVRLLPGDDLKTSLERVVRDRKIDAAVVLGCVGSLERAMVRFADRRDPTLVEGKLEVVSLTGMVSAVGGTHLHLSVSDGEGRTVGGHLKEGSPVYTTAEVALGVAPELRFVREQDARTGYPELFVETR